MTDVLVVIFTHFLLCSNKKYIYLFFYSFNEFHFKFCIPFQFVFSVQYGWVDDVMYWAFKTDMNSRCALYFLSWRQTVLRRASVLCPLQPIESLEKN